LTALENGKDHIGGVSVGEAAAGAGEDRWRPARTFFWACLSEYLDIEVAVRQ